MTQTATMAAKRKSVRLSKDGYNALKKYRRSFPTEVECAESIGIKRETLNRVLLLGSGSPDTIARIEEVIAVKERN